MTTEPIDQKAGILLSLHFRGERMKVRGPNKDSCNLIDGQNMGFSGTLTPTLSRKSAGEGEHADQRENRQPLPRA